MKRLRVVAAGLVILAFALISAIVVLRRSDRDVDAATELTRLSELSSRATYFVTYEDADGAELGVFHAPEHGYRLDLPVVLHLKPIAQEPVLWGGDILFVRRRGDEQSASCNTERGSCRNADEMELSAIASFLSIFSYDADARFQTGNLTHTVRRGGDVELAGERGHCFVLESEGPPVTLCYTGDGIPLRRKVGLDFAMDATHVDRNVSSSVFELPFDFVPSIYDR